MKKKAANKETSAVDAKKKALVARLRTILENDLDDVLQGDYEERGDILARFENVVNDIDDYQN